MKPLDLSKIPTYDQLPVKAGAPKGASWGVFGENDQLGCLNFLTPENLAEAAKLVKRGKVFRLDSKIGFATPPLFGRAAVRHQVLKLGDVGHDDLIDNYNTQEAAQWDGLGHVGHITHKVYYNGTPREQIHSGPGGQLSIHHWNDQFAGRGILIDMYGYRKANGIAVEPISNEEYKLAEFEAALKWQGTVMKPGSIVLVRTGWMEAYERATPEMKEVLSHMETVQAMGVDRSREMAAWLWNHRVAAIAADNPAVETMPVSLDNVDAMHYWALPLMGLPLGELFVLNKLAEDCAADKQYEFLLTSAPMYLEGGIASPPNALAIK